MIASRIRREAELFIRPSSLASLALCEGRALMEAAAAIDAQEHGIAEETSAEAAVGDHAHRITAAAIEEWKRGSGDWDDVIDATEASAKNHGVDGWTILCIRRALKVACRLVMEHQIYPHNVLTEFHLDMAATGFAQGGTADLVLVVPNELVVVADWKQGFLDQGEACDHDQLQAYACAAAATFKAKRVLVYLCQPRQPKEQRLSCAEFDAEALRTNRAWTLAVTRLARAENPPLNAGYHQCLYCRALATCPEAEKFIMNVLEAIEVLGMPTGADALGQAVSARKLAEKRLKPVADYAKAQLMAGAAVTGWRLGEPSARKSIAGPRDALAELEAAGLGEIAAEALSMSVGALTPDALKLIEGRITQKLCEPSMIADRKKGAARNE